MRTPFAIVFLLLVWVAFPLRAIDTNDPAAELASFQVTNGFQVNLFASEADGVVKPIQCRFDHRGRLFVACSAIYPQIEPGRKPDDKIMLLEDTDGDGKADKKTVFADGLFIPTGIEPGDGGLYVGNATELLHLKDTNDDGRADVRTVVLHGFGTGDSHQNINSFHWGPGGELFMSQGLHAFSKIETPWGTERLYQAGIWRFRPKRMQLDGFYGGGMAPHNPWGFVHDHWGQIIVVAGNGHGIFYPLPVMIRGHRYTEQEQIWENHQGRKLCGVDMIGNSHTPPELQGHMVAGGFINNTIFTLQLKENGAGFTVSDLPPLLRSTHNSFRPVDVKIGPDGAIYVADWYNPIIGHYQASFRHPDRDKQHGRIWRITAKGRQLSPAPRLDNLSVDELINQLSSTERFNRYHAKRLLAEQSPSKVAGKLRKWIGTKERSEHELVEALGVFENIEVVEPGLLRRLLRAQDARARAYATGVIQHWHDRLENPLALLEPQFTDEHPRVRLAAVVSATYIRSAATLPAMLGALEKPRDKFISYALKQAIHATKGAWLAAFQADQLRFKNPQRDLEYLISADSSPDTFGAVRALLASNKATPETRKILFRVVGETGQPADLALLLQTHGDDELQKTALQALAHAKQTRNVSPKSNLSEKLKPFLQAPATEREAVVLAGLWQLTDHLPQVTNAAVSHVDPGLREAAINALGHYTNALAIETLRSLTAGGQDESLRARAIISLAKADLSAGATEAARAFSTGLSESATKQIVSAFIKRTGGLAALREALKAQELSEQKAALLYNQLVAYGSADEQWQKLLMPPKVPTSFTDAELRQFAKEIQTKGDAARGAAIFRRAELGCQVCHAIGGQGGNLGPDLNSIGSAQPLDFIIGAVISPNKEIKEGYETVEVETKDGETFQGFRIREDKSEVVLRDAVLNRQVQLPASRIAAKRNRGSLMPAGLVDSLSREELRDLFKYLSQLGRGAGL